MNSPLANLTSLERRFVVGVAVVVFVVLNVLFVWPRFQDRFKAQQRRAAAGQRLETYRAAIKESTNVQVQVTLLEGAGIFVPQAEQSKDFLTTINNAAIQTAVNIQSSRSIPQATNDPFFLEQAQDITLNAREENLVNFLYLLSSGNSLITVRGLALRPDQPRQQLNATLKLVASYQKKSSVKTGPPGAAASAATPASPTRNR